MHKDKSGKVFASLTEVKNKTGDIFALVDEFGEVYITSYNKTRYKISKMDISNFLSLERNSREREVVSEPEEVEEIKHSAPKEIKAEEKSLFPRKVDLDIFNRDNKREKDFVRNATKPLVNN